MDHLYDMGILSLSRRAPREDGFYAILQIHEQRQAKPLLWRSHEDANRTKQMTEDVLRFGTIFRFLMKFFNAGHPPGFLALFHTIANKHNHPIDGSKGSRLFHDLKPLY